MLNSTSFRKFPAFDDNSKKRDRTDNSDDDDDDKSRNRGNYRCSKCNLPKKGHICPFQQRTRKKDIANAESVAVSGELLRLAQFFVFAASPLS